LVEHLTVAVFLMNESFVGIKWSLVQFRQFGYPL